MDEDIKDHEGYSATVKLDYTNLVREVGLMQGWQTCTIRGLEAITDMFSERGGLRSIAPVFDSVQEVTAALTKLSNAMLVLTTSDPGIQGKTIEDM